MSIFARKAAGPEKVGTEVEGAIRELVSRDVAEPQRQLANDGEMAVNDLCLLLQRVSVDSVQKIDVLISDLKMLRERLHHEGERMAQEIVDYASLGPVATHSAKIIAEHLTHWRRAPDARGISE